MFAQDVDDDPPEFLPGLIAEYSVGAQRYRRVDEELTFVGAGGDADERLPQAPFRVRWSGHLQVREAGPYVLQLFVAGTARVTLNGQELISATSQSAPAATAEWWSAEPVELRFGRHAIEVEYAAGDVQPSLGLYWSGPTFATEPIGPPSYGHASEDHPVDALSLGRTLSRGLRCAACHEFPRSSEVVSAPALTHLSGNLHSDWIVARLTDAGDQHGAPASRGMPHFGLAPDDAFAVSAALLDASAESLPPTDLSAELEQRARARQKNAPAVRVTADRRQGAMTFASKGCIACHSVNGQASPSAGGRRLFAGGDLSQIASKRTAAFFVRWLEDPATVNPHHRMPIFELSLNERHDLAAYLSGLGAGEVPLDAADAAGQERSTGLIARGRELIALHRCGACHELPAALPRDIAKLPIASSQAWTGGCLGPPQASRQVPGYALTADEIDAVRRYLTGDARLLAEASAEQLIEENNCLACHARGLGGGIAAHFPELAEEYPELAPRLPAMAPPSLTSVGDKLQDAALLATIAGTRPGVRPWLDIQMPKFKLSPADRQRLVDYLISGDRIPSRPTPPLPLPSDKATELAAGRLVTAEGFGCQSCHKIGDSEPPQVALNAHGTDLTMLGERIRPSWFDRWVRNPARIVPRMEMPAIQTAAQGVLNDSLDMQLAALWRTLNTPDFQPPKPNPVRVVRNHFDPGLAETTHVLTDVLETPDKLYLRPLLFGLPNRNNVLFDLEAGELATWWLGDTGHQHTRGKSWFWEPGARSLLEQPPGLERLRVVDARGVIWSPLPLDQVAVELDSIAHENFGVKWSGRMHLGHSQQRRVVSLEQCVEAVGQFAQLHTRLSGLESGEQVLIETPGRVAMEGERLTVRLDELNHAEFFADACRLQQRDEQGILVVPPAGQQHVAWTSRYLSQLKPDRFPQAPFVAPEIKPQPLDCVPGYAAVKLPLPPTEMPISFAWSPTGELYAGSLKGRVVQVIDRDGDGLEDTYRTISDEIPTPYGLYVTDAGVDALAKFALLRLTPPAADQPQESIWNSRVVADGWGYTNDYHDWAVGLERDSAGNYYMALPCQQDDRSPAAAYLRGHALKLIPDEDSESARDSSRRYRLESFAAGLRFPMGIALSSSGDLFTTDNQGNYNPFNELNHLRHGKRYGFINKLEKKDGFAPPFEEPAIDIPHPWTRSVNGICFLRTPEPLKRDDGNDLFGPFEGHLIGCEMNGRFLIRMSLQQVDDTYQGAAYLFSRITDSPADGFDGPIVCEVSPQGDVLVGNLHDSGWGGGQNTGSIVRLRPAGPLPLGIAEVRARRDGFEVDFTAPVSPKLASDPANYSIRSYRRVSTPAYGGDDQDVRSETVRSVQVSADGRQAVLALESLREGCVYEINIAPVGEQQTSLFPSEAHYTLRKIPK